MKDQVSSVFDDVTVSLIIVVRNEKPGIQSVIPQIPEGVFDECFAVDGHSTDGSQTLLEEFGIPVFLQDEPGLGAAMMCARRHTKTSAFVFFHPDGNEDPNDLAHMAGLLKQGRDFIVASRMTKGAFNEEDDQFFKPRKSANLAFALIANVLFAKRGNRTTDVTNGFRGITTAAWDRMELSSKDLTMDYQMVIRALKLGIPITEFPTREGTRIGAETHFASIPTGIAELRLLWREWRLGRHHVSRE